MSTIPKGPEHAMRHPDSPDLRRRKDFILFCSAIAGVGMMAFICAWFLLRPSGTHDEKKWAMMVLSAIVSGLIGFLTGKASKRTSRPSPPAASVATFRERTDADFRCHE